MTQPKETVEPKSLPHGLFDVEETADVSGRRSGPVVSSTGVVPRKKELVPTDLTKPATDLAMISPPKSPSSLSAVRGKLASSFVVKYRSETFDLRHITS